MHQAVPVLDNSMKITVLLYNSLLLMMELLNVNCHFLISCLVTPDTLTDMANQMTEKVGLVHGLPYVADRQGFAATLEQVSTVCVCMYIYVFNILLTKSCVVPLALLSDGRFHLFLAAVTLWTV